MFRPAQNTVYTTGIMLKGTFTPEASQTIGTDGQPVEDPLVFKTLYYFNYKFYTTLAAVGEHGDANIDGLTEASSDADLAAKQITRFTKMKVISPPSTTIGSNILITAILPQWA